MICRVVNLILNLQGFSFHVAIARPYRSGGGFNAKQLFNFNMLLNYVAVQVNFRDLCAPVTITLERGK